MSQNANAKRNGKSQPTTLGFALLGLVNAEPRSGYALRMVFETTPMGRFSSSPGSIYPAIRNLEAMGLVEDQNETGGVRILHLTKQGLRVLRTWLAAPVLVEEYDHDPDRILLRFAFLDAMGDVALTIRFLESFEQAVETSSTQLDAFLRSPDGKGLTLHGRLAVGHGVAARKAALGWARFAIREIKSSTLKTGKGVQ